MGVSIAPRRLKGRPASPGVAVGALVRLTEVAPIAAAQQAPYPSKLVRMIASQAPGGGIDSLCRIVAPMRICVYTSAVVAVAVRRSVALSRADTSPPAARSRSTTAITSSKVSGSK